MTELSLSALTSQEPPAMSPISHRQRVYFAGKIGQNDWRHHLVPELHGALGPGDRDLFDPEFVIDCGEFIYGGPFFVSCDHGCFHGPNNHGGGIIANERGDDAIIGSELAERRRQIFNINLGRLRLASHVFAYLDTPECYGTLIELGLARAYNVPIALGFSAKLSLDERDDLWMAQHTARHLYVGTADECWRQFSRDNGLGP